MSTLIGFRRRKGMFEPTILGAATILGDEHVFVCITPEGREALDQEAIRAAELPEEPAEEARSGG